jgi:hypothetical protein
MQACRKLTMQSRCGLAIAGPQLARSILGGFLEARQISRHELATVGDVRPFVALAMGIIKFPTGAG